MATSTIQASGVMQAVQKSYKSAYDVTTNNDLVGALNEMGSDIPIERGFAYYALRTFGMTETSPYLPKGNWACLAFHFNATSFAVLLYSYNFSDIYIYRNVGNTSGNRYIVKFEGTNVRNW